MQQTHRLMSKKPLILLGLGLSLGIFIISLLILRSDVRKHRQEKYKQLETIAQLKIDQLSSWVNERLADARFHKDSPFFIQEVIKFIESGQDPKLAKIITRRLEIVCTEYQYQDAFLTTLDGRFLIGKNSTGNERISTQTLLFIRQAGQDRQIHYSDFYFCPEHHRIHIDFIVPIIDDQKQVRAALILRIAPEEYLFPYLQKWPLPTKTGETILVRQDGDSVVYLNNLRFQPNSALKLRFPLTATEIPAVQVVLGKVGISEGKDYRDVPVIAYSDAVPNTNWYLIAKIDKAEILAEVIKQIRLTLLVIFLLLVMVISSLVLFFNIRQRGIYEALYQEAIRVQQMEEQFRIIWETSRDGMRLCDGEGKIIRVNPAFCELVRLKAEELIGKPITVIYDPADAPRILARHQERFRTGTIPPYMERQLKLHDGRERWFEVSNSLIQLNGDQLVLNMFRDITERKQMEAALVENQQYLKAVLDSLTEAVFVDDADTFQVIDVNQGMCNLYGLTYEEALRTPIADISFGEPPYSGEDAKRWLLKARKEGPQVFEWLARRKNGELFWVEVSVRFAIIGGKNRFVVVVRDISKRKAAEEALRASESRYRAIFEGSRDAMMTLTPPDWFFTSGNPAVFKVFGVENLEQFITCKPWQLSPEFQPDGRRSEEKALEMIQTAMQNGSHFFEWMHCRLNGAPFPASVLLTRIDMDNYSFLLATVRDLTEEKALQEKLRFQEAQLRQTQKMEALGQLASGIAHDFNNILGIIMGHAALLKNQLPKSDKIKNSIETIEKTSQRGANLVKHLLTLARKSEPVSAPFNLTEMIKETITILKETFPRNIRIESKLLSGLPYIIADGSQIHQVLMNLCLNARDAMPDGGVLTITTEIVEKAALSHKYPNLTSQTYIRLDVSDTGAGIAPELLERIFDPFYTTKAPGKGTGLGLTTVQSIVRNHDGFVEVVSQPGVGSTFSVYLPVPALPAVEIEEQDEQATIPVKGHETILIIEDEEPLIELLSEIMEMHGYRLLTAKNGREGVEIYHANQDKIDLVLTDMGLPGITGDEVFRRIKQINPNVRVIIASGFVDPDHKSELLKAGVALIIQKPYLPEVVLQSVREVLDQTERAVDS